MVRLPTTPFPTTPYTVSPLFPTLSPTRAHNLIAAACVAAALVAIGDEDDGGGWKGGTMNPGAGRGVMRSKAYGKNHAPELSACALGGCISHQRATAARVRAQI